MRASVTGSRRLILVIVLFCLLLNTLIWVDMLEQHKTERKAAIATAVQRNANLSVALEQYTIRTIQNADAILQLLQMEYKNKGRNIDFASINNQPFFKNALYNGCAIIDSEGKLIASSIRIHPDSALNFSERPFFKYHQSTQADSLYFGKPIMSLTIHQPVITLSRRIWQPDGRFDGVIAMQIAPAAFTRLYAGAQLRSKDIVSLIAPDGTTYARRTGSHYSYGENISKSPLFHHLAKSATGSYLAKDAIHNIPTYFSYRQLNQLPIIATIGTAESDVLAEYEESIGNDYEKAAMISLLIVLFGLLLVIMLFNRKRNLQKLKESETKYRSIFENSRDAILLLAKNGAIIDMNEAACNIFRIGEREKKGLHFSALLSAAAVADQHILHTGSYHAELPFKKADGSSFIGEMASASYKDDSAFEMIIAIIRDLTERKAMEKKLMLEKKRRQRIVTKHIIVGQEREREAIGRELHDNINQVLTSAKLYLEVAIKEPGQSELFLPKCQQLIVSSINDIRNLSHNLSAPTLGTRSLIDATNTLLETVAAGSGLSIHFCHESYQENIDPDIKLAIYRIIQEQVSNIIKHAQAQTIQINLVQDNSQLKLEITDDGAGFDLDENRKGIGFNNIESRVKMFDGHVAFVAAPGAGCQLHARFPLHKVLKMPPAALAKALQKVSHSNRK